MITSVAEQRNQRKPYSLFNIKKNLQFMKMTNKYQANKDNGCDTQKKKSCPLVIRSSLTL